MREANHASGIQIALAWGVHAFTASGAIFGVASLLAILNGDFRASLLLMLAALFIDAVDGMLARAVGVSKVLPSFDGRRLDDMVDYFNFVLVPAVFMVAAGVLAHAAFAVLPVMASAYGFSRVDAKTEDDFFLGFPSYWNIVAIYAWLFHVGPLFGTVVVTLLSVLVFVPFKYVYPSRLKVLWKTNAVFSFMSFVLVAYALFDPEVARDFHLAAISISYPIFYLALSARLGGLHRRAT